MSDRMLAGQRRLAADGGRSDHAPPRLTPVVMPESPEEVRSGFSEPAPCIRGLRITVFDVLEYLAGGMTPEQIVADFPDLTLNDIRACLAFAADRERKLVKVPA